MTSSGPNQSEIESESAVKNTRIVGTESRCTYPNERRERNQIYTLLNISNSVNEQEEKSLECVAGTGWEEAVQGWGKTAPFAYLQLQKRARKTRTSESVNGCLYCLDLMQIIDKGLEQNPRTIDQLKSDFKLSACSATESIPEKQQTLLYPDTHPSSAIDDTKQESYYGKTYYTQTSQGEKKKMSLKEVQTPLSERKIFQMKESLLYQAEKKAVPIKEYNILPPGKPKSFETLKCKDVKSHEASASSLVSSETPTAKSSLVLPPLKDSALKNSLDPSPKKSKTSEKPFGAVSETRSCLQVSKPKEQKCGKGIDTMGDAVKEAIKMHEIASFAPRLPKTSFLSRNSDRCCWRCAFLPDRKMATLSNSIALRRTNHLNSMHFLHIKGAQGSKADEIRDPCVRSRSHNGTKQRHEPPTQEIPLLSGLFPAVTEYGWGKAPPFTCNNIQRKKPRITNTAHSSILHQNMAATSLKNMAWITRPARDQPKSDCRFNEGETLPSNKNLRVSCIKPYNYAPMMSVHAGGDRMRGKLDSLQTFLGEKRSLPVKEYETKSSQRRPEPRVLGYHEVSPPKVIHSNPPSSLSCVTLNALLVFRPDEEGVISLHLKPSSKEEAATAVNGREKRSSSSDKMASHYYEIKEVKQKSEKRIGMINTEKKQIKKSCTAH
ncbi:uncharacterized protein C16orf46 homolog isoform X2 [Hemicordylus capensis]|uniref:uncharacterized protein C16orf46 homolog isoform X2 n=1 Tax=Hemicordylus capensis TaxID=884348 RepID=UPI002302CEB0|nr:uncharacterized protein C16orf46 homolog isoform X2 [Hemicordylus capensis]